MAESNKQFIDLDTQTRESLDSANLSGFLNLEIWPNKE